MNRAIRRAVCFALLLTFVGGTAHAQAPMIGLSIGAGFGGYGGGIGPYGAGFGGYGPGAGVWPGYGGFGPGYGSYGYGLGFGGFGLGYGGYGPGFGGYGAFAFSQQSFRLQALLTQGIFIQQQQALLGQIGDAEERLKSLDAVKQELFKKFLNFNESDKAALRDGLIADYLKLDPQARDGWKRDGVVQAILGADVYRLDGVAEFQAMHPDDQARFRQAMLERFQQLPANEKQNWQNDRIITLVMGKNWWQ
jgi:hypothetical protein